MTQLDDIIDDLDAPCDEQDIIEHERWAKSIMKDKTLKTQSLHLLNL